MALRQPIFLFFLADSSSGNCFYVDAGGNPQKAPIGAGFDVLLQTPDGWMNSTLSFVRNARYYGLNRSYTVPQKLVNDAATLVRKLTNNGRGIEVPLTMLVFKFNDQPQPGDPQYELYYKGQLDLPNHTDIAGEGYQVNMMEGNVLQLLKYIENTVIQIPCDGSLNEAFPDGTFARNLKANRDGMLFQDTFNYQITPMRATVGGVSPLPCVFIDEDGDNAGVVHNNPTYDPLVNSPYVDNYYQASPNYLMGSAEEVTLTIEGSITVGSADTTKPVGIELFLATNQSIPIPGTNELTRSLSLLPAGGPSGSGTAPTFGNQTVLPFNQTFTISAGSTPENMFLQFNNLLGNPADLIIVGGSFKVTFSAMYPATRIWGVTLYDLGRVLVKYACQIASEVGPFTFNYQFVSTLLQNNLNLVATSGDALRASGDPNYQKFYNAVQNNPNFPNINLVYSYGPVIKTTLAEFFDSVNAILGASLSTQTLAGQGETLFIESKGYVFDSSVINLDNGEVSDFRTSVATDLYFTLLKIGYEPQQYDQKAGKYAFHTTLELQSPIKSIPHKELTIISKYIADPFLIEKLCGDIDNVSTTRNNSDNAVFLLNTDPSSKIFDYYSASFVSPNTLWPSPGNPDGAGNTNTRLVQNQQLQSLPMTVILGSYLAFSNDPTIFLLNQIGLSAVSLPLTLLIQGNFTGYAANALSGLPADTTTINLVINGVVVQSWSFTASGAIVPINISYTLTRGWSFKDCVYLTCSTSANGTTTLSSVSLVVANGSGTGVSGANYFSAAGAEITIDPGEPAQLVALPVVGYAKDSHSLPVVSFGFQYFYFNSALLASQDVFNGEIAVTLLQTGGSSDLAGFDVFLNGVPVHSNTWAGTSGVSQDQDSYSFTRAFQLGDIIFLLGSATNLRVWYTAVSLLLTSTSIQAVGLKRLQYDYIAGLPVLLGYTPAGVPVTTGPGAVYNLEDLTPARMTRKHGNWLRSILFDQIPGKLQFSTLSKNEFVATSYQGTSFIENADIDIASLDPILFYPRYLTYKTRVQETFATIMTGAANGHVSNTFFGVPFYGFPNEMKQKPALNEMQEWKMLASPLTNLSDLNNLEFTGLNSLNMSPNSIFCSFLSPVQFVPSGQVLPSKYHTYNRNYYWFVEQVGRWINQNNYWQPWQNTDPCNLQFITRDLTQVVVKLYDCTGNLISSTTLTETTGLTNAIVAPYHLWEGSIDLSSLPVGAYYMTAVAGTGTPNAILISEGLYVQPNWVDTTLFEWTHSGSKFCMVFDTGYSPAMRVRGLFDNQFKQKFKGAFYTDQMQDIQILNSFPYETTSLWCGLDDGIPDYVHRKVSWALLCDGCMIEGEGYSIDEGASWEETFIPGNPKKFQKIEIRPSQNVYGISATATGTDTDTAMMITLDAGAFGPNIGNTGGQDPDIIQITINP